MISDLFDGYTCKHCGYRWEYGNGMPLLFQRIDSITHSEGIDYRCICGNCQKTFVLAFQYTEGIRNGKEKDRRST